MVVDITGEAEVIAEVSFTTALTTLHEKAIYLHEARQYHVERFDYDERKAYVKRVESDYYTDAIDYTQVKVLEECEGETHRRAWRFGDVRVNRQIVGFKKIKFYTNVVPAAQRVHAGGIGGVLIRHVHVWHPQAAVPPHVVVFQVGSSAFSWAVDGTNVLSWITSGISADGMTFWCVGLAPALLVPLMRSCSALSRSTYGAASPAYTLRRVMPYEWSW